MKFWELPLLILCHLTNTLILLWQGCHRLVMHCVYSGHTVFVGRLSAWDVARSTAMSRLTYASPAWYGYLNKNSLNKIQGVINRFKRYGYLPADQEDFSVICETKTMYSISCCHLLNWPLTTSELELIINNHSLPRADNNLRKNFIKIFIKPTFRYF